MILINLLKKNRKFFVLFKKDFLKTKKLKCKNKNTFFSIVFELIIFLKTKLILLSKQNLKIIKILFIQNLKNFFKID